MPKRAFLSLVAALVMTVTAAGAALAAPTNTANVSLTITPGSELSVVITGSNNFPNQAFSLTNAPGNYSYSAYYNVQVVDGRGTGDGWNVTANATAFSPSVPGSGLPTVNNHCNGAWPGPDFCAAPGSISNGVAVVAGSPDIIAGAGSIFVAHAGSAPGPQPNGTGTFTTQEVVYYTGFPVAIQAGTYTTTITLSIAGSNP